MTRSRACASVALGLAVVGCAGRFDPANFEGSREARRAEPEAIVELAARSNDLEALGGVHATCTLKPGFRRLDGEVLSDLDCSTERLILVLRESAAAAGGEALVGLHCSARRLGISSRETHRVSCAAEVARFSGNGGASERPLAVPRSIPPSLPAPSSSEVKRIDEPDAALAFRITLVFEPNVKAFDRGPRASSEVNELPTMPLFDRALGDLQAHCDDGCEERALRHSVLVAAGRLGAPDVVGVRCFSSGGGSSCVGTLAAPERDE